MLPFRYSVDMVPLKTSEDLRAEMGRLLLAEGVTQREAAEKLGISLPYFNDVLHGHRGMSKQLAGRLGYEQVVRWRKKGS